MKPIFFTVAIFFSLCLHQLQAQKSTVGFQTGATFSNMYYNNSGVQSKNSNYAGYTFGLITNFPVSRHFSLMPELRYMQKGNVVVTNVQSADQKTTTALRYAELPFNLVYNSNGPSGNNFFAGAGPYFSVGLQSKKVVSFGGQKVTTDITMGKKLTDNFSATDYGANMLAGVRLKCGAIISIHYSLGAYDITLHDNTITRNNSFGISLGWMFKN